MAKIKLIDLYECVQSALLASGAGKHTINNYRHKGFYPLKRYFEQKGCMYYSRKVADEFVSSSWIAYQNDLLPKIYQQHIRKVAALLDEYHNTNMIKRTRLPRCNTTLLTCKYFDDVLTQYCQDMMQVGKYSTASSIESVKSIVKHFLLYLEEQGHRNLSRLTRKFASSYLPIAAQKRPGSMPSVIGALKSFFIYLYDCKLVACEIASALPSYPTRRKKRIVGFTREEAKTLISTVPSDTGHGKRNIAIFILGESTGLRGIDIVNMKLNDIDWRNKTISIIQHKTKRPLILPLENHVGDALAEYILHGRPESDSSFIFLAARWPFSPIGRAAVSSATSRYIKSSGIENSASSPKGFHCFRRGVGTWLLEAELPLSMISEILGHRHINSAKPYLSTDLNGLRECAIGLDGIEIRKGLFK